MPIAGDIIARLAEHRAKAVESGLAFGLQLAGSWFAVPASPDKPEQPTSPKSLGRKLALAAKRLGIKRPSFHRLRHFAATALLEDGERVEVVAVPRNSLTNNRPPVISEAVEHQKVSYPRVPVAHTENFPVASWLLPAGLREPVEVIYRFAREADDIADEGGDPQEVRLRRLNHFYAQLALIGLGETPEEPLFRDVARVVRRHELPPLLLRDLLDAFSQDVTKTRYADYAELLEYCRRSANPVGRLLLHLFKRTSATDLEQSDAVCSALQLTNFWQDVALDFGKGRIYLPQDEMRKHGVSEEHIATGRCDDAWRALMTFQVRRTRELMLSGAPLGRALPGRIGLEIRATVQGGLRILERIEKVDFDVFRRRPALQWFDWPLLAARAL